MGKCWISTILNLVSSPSLASSRISPSLFGIELTLKWYLTGLRIEIPWLVTVAVVTPPFEVRDGTVLNPHYSSEKNVPRSGDCYSAIQCPQGAQHVIDCSRTDSVFEVNSRIGNVVAAMRHFAFRAGFGAILSIRGEISLLPLSLDFCQLTCFVSQEPSKDTSS